MDQSHMIELLGAEFPKDQIFYPGTAEYTDSNESYLSKRQSEISPACIVSPKTREDVVKFVRAIQECRQNQSVSVAIRGRGQQAALACNNIEGGITLDLRGLTGVRIEPGVVSVGAGESWATVYEKLQSEGLGVNGGRSGKGGLAGLSLQGKHLTPPP